MDIDRLAREMREARIQAEGGPSEEDRYWTCRCGNKIDLLANASDIVFLGAYDGVLSAANPPCCHSMCRKCLATFLWESGNYVPATSDYSATFTVGDFHIEMSKKKSSNYQSCIYHNVSKLNNLFCPHDRKTIQFYLSFPNNLAVSNPLERYAIKLFAQHGSEILANKFKGRDIAKQYPMTKDTEVKRIFRKFYTKEVRGAELDANLAAIMGGESGNSTPSRSPAPYRNPLPVMNVAANFPPSSQLF